MKEANEFSYVEEILDGEILQVLNVETFATRYVALIRVVSEGSEKILRMQVTRFGVKRLDTTDGSVRPGLFELVKHEALQAALTAARKK